MSLLPALISSTNAKVGAAPEPVTPTLGTGVFYTSNGTATDMDWSSDITLTEGQGVLIAAAFRNNGNPGATISAMSLDAGSVALTLGPVGYLAGSGRTVVAVGVARGVSAGTYTPRVTADDANNRDFVGYAFPIDGLPAAGSFIGSTPAGSSVNSSASSITGAITATNAASLLVGVGAFGIGSGADLTANNSTLKVANASGAGATGFDVSFAIVSRASSLSELTLGVDSDTADDDRALVLIELLPS